MPTHARGCDNSEISILWSDSILFQKLQHFTHGDISINSYLEYLKNNVRRIMTIIEAPKAPNCKNFNVTSEIVIEPKFPHDEKGSPMYLGLRPIQLSKTVLNKMSKPIVNIATEKTGSPTIGLRKVLSIIKLSTPVRNIPKIKASQKGMPLSTAKELIIPAPTTASAGWAKLRTSIDL